MEQPQKGGLFEPGAKSYKFIDALYVINESGEEGIYNDDPPFHIRTSPKSDIAGKLDNNQVLSRFDVNA